MACYFSLVEIRGEMVGQRLISAGDSAGLFQCRVGCMGDILEEKLL